MTYQELKLEFAKISFKKELVNKLGSVCVNCESTENIEYHHIVPLKNGGTNKITNIVPLCEVCHYKAHDKESFKPKNAGRPKKYIGDKYSNAIKLLEQGHSYNQVADMTGISRRTLIRYKKEHDLKQMEQGE